MKYYLAAILAVCVALPFATEASPGGPPSLGCDDIFQDCATKPELQAAYDDLQGQIDNIELTPGPQGEQGIQGVAGQDGVGIDGQDGADGQDADMTLVNANTDGVAANAAAIAINSADIGSNSQGISDNSNAIAAVESDSIGRDNALASGIAQNRSLINDNAEEIEWIKGELKELEGTINDGVSQAMAMGIIPDAENGRFGFGVGCASYHSKDNCAVGLAWTNADGRHKLKSAFTEDGASAGYMYSF